MNRVLQEILRCSGMLVGPGLVAVSGGADSIALLFALREAGIGPLTVAHFNHHFRGEESDGDEHFVRNLAERLNLPVFVGHANGLSERGNLEANAREKRYQWLTEQAHELNADWIATGHTADDQAETVLHRILRGTGIRGLRGIALERLLGEVRLVRPLLGVSRKELRDYLDDRPFRTDSMNFDPKFTRTRIRRELLPLLERVNPHIVELLGRLAEQACEKTFQEEERILDHREVAELPRAGKVLVFDAEMLARFDPVPLFRHVWLRERWPRDGMTFDHWQRLGALTVGDYPGGISLRKVGRVVQLGPRKK